MRCKLELVTGFLGAGKTAFINAYIKSDICKNSKILILQLEKGNEFIDDSLGNIKVIQITRIENLDRIIEEELKNKYYHKILIEFNGTEKLEKLKGIFINKNINRRIDFYGNYYVADSKTLNMYIENMGEILLPFIQTSKLIILNNFKLIDRKKQEVVKVAIEKVNAVTPIIYSDNLRTLEKELKDSKFFKDTIIDKIYGVILNK